MTWSVTNLRGVFGSARNGTTSHAQAGPPRSPVAQPIAIPFYPISLIRLCQPHRSRSASRLSPAGENVFFLWLAKGCSNSATLQHPNSQAWPEPALVRPSNPAHKLPTIVRLAPTSQSSLRAVQFVPSRPLARASRRPGDPPSSLEVGACGLISVFGATAITGSSVRGFLYLAPFVRTVRRMGCSRSLHSWRNERGKMTSEL